MLNMPSAIIIAALIIGASIVGARLVAPYQSTPTGRINTITGAMVACGGTNNAGQIAIRCY